MRIVAITRYFPSLEHPYRGRSAYETFRRLRGVDLHVVSVHAKYPSWLLPRTFPYEVTAQSHPPSDMRNARYIEYLALPAITRPFNGLSIARKIRPQVAALRPDLILSYIIYPDGFAAVKIGRELGIPVVVKDIGSDLNRIPDRITRHLTRWTLKNATYVLTVSGDLREKSIRLGSEPCRTIVIQNGCDTTIFYPADRRIARAELGLPADCRLALFV